MATADSALVTELRAEGDADLFIGFTERADLESAYDIDDWTERGAWVAQRLRSVARDSQRAARAKLDAAGVDYETFWVANTILVNDAPIALAEQLVATEGVTRLYEVAERPVPSLRKDDDDGPSTRQLDPVEWGVAAIGADRIWSQLGVRGEEIVVAGIDTGVEFDHPALVERYRGTTAGGGVEHDYNWFDPTGICGTPSEPCDTHGHGTHTLGTMAGGRDGDGTGIGVAPGARWIAAKGCEAAGGVGCRPDSLLRAGQWTLEPTDRSGADPRADLRPHIVNNSWGADTGEVADPFYDQIVDAWNASGIFAVFSNGNDGANGCRTAGSPADSPNAYGVGAYDEDGAIAPFSSRGPAADGQVRPNLAAPGVAVRSAIPGGEYGAGNGTSMAAPHVAGAVALLWSAAPALIGDVSGTRDLLDQTAIDTDDLSCGGTAENNNVFGEGRLDAWAAAAAAPIGPSGQLTGLLTEAGEGSPIARAEVTATPVSGDGPARRTRTGEAGRFSLTLPAGEWEVEVDAYGYRPPQAASVTVTADEVTEFDRALDALPMVRVSGTVTDGSGHGWPLYAGLTIAGYPHGTLYTDPETGRYEVELPADTTYRIDVDTPYTGYRPVRRDLVIGDTAEVVDLELIVDAERHCPALGYRPAYAGGFEPFDSGERPDGWTVATGVGDGWLFDNPGGRSNLTGGDGGFAIVDANNGNRREASVLTSPVTDLSDATEPELAFRVDYLRSRDAEIGADLSLDGGVTWERVWHRTERLRGPELIRLPLPQAAGEAEVRVRFEYDGNNGVQTGYWELDEVLLGEVSCEPIPGGLVVGRVQDAGTGAALDSATVTLEGVDGEPDTSVRTRAVPDDPDLVGGFYWLFAEHAGERRLAAENPLGQHHRSTTEVDVAASGAVRADLELGTGGLEVEVADTSLATVLGERAGTTVTLTNTGTAPASFELVERDAAQKVPDPNDSRWKRLANLPLERFRGVVGVSDDELLYIGGGGNGASPTRQRNFRYDTRTDEWSIPESFQDYRSNPAGGFIGDEMYVIGGDGGTAGLQATVLAYHPETDSWRTGTDAPTAFVGAGHAVYSDQMFVIGGYDEDGLIDTVQVYDAEADSWRIAASYPEPAAGQMCGTVDGTIFCAGGVVEGADSVAHSRRAYGYRPESDSWFRIADLPLSVVGAGHTAANGLLLLSGGQIGGYRSNEGFYYDPAAGDWQPMPRSLFDLFQVAGGCGFYKVAGTQGRPGIFPWVEYLPGFDDCDSSGGDRVPWLTPQVSAATLQPGESLELDLTVDTSVLDQPGGYGVELAVLEDTPQSVRPLTVDLEVAPPRKWGAISGTVTGMERCDGDIAPLAGATVRFTGRGLDASVTTGEDGSYTYWLPSRHRHLSRVMVRAEYPNMVAVTRPVRPVAGRTVTRNFTLRTDEPCATALPGEVETTVHAGERTTATVRLSNADGEAAYHYRATVSGHVLDPLPKATAAAAEWGEATAVPGGRRLYGHAQCAGDSDVAYIFGGVTTAGPTTRRSWRYDASDDSWSELPQLPVTGTSVRAACEAGRIHVLVARVVNDDGSAGITRHFVYDIARNTWSEAAPLDREVIEPAIAAWNGRIYLVGGDDPEAAAAVDTVSVYEIATDSWSEGPSAPVATSSAGFAAGDGALYVVGGRDRARPSGDRELDTVQRLDLPTGTWTSGPALGETRAESGVALTDRALYVIGGRGPGRYGPTPTDTVQRLELTEWDGGEWRTDTLPALPTTAAGNYAGWCTTSGDGAAIWATGGVGLVNRALFMPVAGETCAGVTSNLPWLTLDRRGRTGTVEPGQQEHLTVRINAAGLDPGTYTATVLVDTTDPGAPELRIPIRLEVTRP